MSQKYIEAWVSVGLFAALVVVVSLLLSSCRVEASHGSHFTPITVGFDGQRNRVDGGLERYSALVWAPTRSVFDSPQPPVRFIYVWPKLPSTTEQQARIAYDRLAELVVRVEKEKAEEKARLELQLDWEAGRKALGLAVLCLGVIVTVAFGFWGTPRQKGG